MKKRPQIDRPKQQLPGDIVRDIQGAIRNQFYPDSFSPQPSALNPWFQNQHFIKREFTLYLATWLDRRGVTLKPERYKALLLDLLNDIKAHGNTAAVKYWPGYLKHVLQEHLKHHGEDLYNEAKSLRNLAENTLLALGGACSTAPHSAPQPDPVTIMAAARRDLLTNKRKKHPSKTKTTQLDLL